MIVIDFENKYKKYNFIVGRNKKVLKYLFILIVIMLIYFWIFICGNVVFFRVLRSCGFFIIIVFN